MSEIKRIEEHDLPLVRAQLVLIEMRKAEVEKQARHLARLEQEVTDFILARYGVNVSDGSWSLDAEHGRLVAE